MESAGDAKKRNDSEEVPETSTTPTTINAKSKSKKKTETISGNKFTIDYSKNGRAKCKECGKAIAKGELRIGKYVPFKNIHITQFLHTNCAFQSFERARVALNIISDINNIDGIEAITDSDRQTIHDMIMNANATRINPLPDETKRIKKSDSESPMARLRVKKLRSSNIPSMKILFTNADQLTTNKMAELQTKIKQEKPLIVAVSEVKLKKLEKTMV